MWWPTKKILGFRWSKKAKIPLETISFWWNISISTFSFSLFLYIMKGCRWNLTNFSKFTNALIRKEKKHSYSSQWENKNWAKVWLCFITSCFIKPFKMIIISFFYFASLIRSPIFTFCYQDDARNIKSGYWERQIAGNGKL